MPGLKRIGSRRLRGGVGDTYGNSGYVQWVGEGQVQWTVPEGVRRICMVCVGAGSAGGQAGDSYVARGDETFCLANGGTGSAGGSGGVKDGGGNGGRPGTSGIYQGAGGAGGYSGSGGRGGYTTSDREIVGARSGSGGAGGGGGTAQYNAYTSGGGGVGLLGEGPSGPQVRGGSFGQDSKNLRQSDYAGIGGACGGGGTGNGNAGGGGELSWVNDIDVSAGDILDIMAAPGQGLQGGSGGVAIIWGLGTFPKPAGLMGGRR